MIVLERQFKTMELLPVGILQLVFEKSCAPENIIERSFFYAPVCKYFKSVIYSDLGSSAWLKIHSSWIDWEIMGCSSTPFVKSAIKICEKGDLEAFTRLLQFVHPSDLKLLPGAKFKNPSQLLRSKIR